MNIIPCPLCAHLHERAVLAFIKREYAETARLENELQEHRAKCEIINSSWYLGLWSNARVGQDVIQAVQE